MELLVAGLIIFFVMHLVPVLGSLRQAMLKRLGQNGYKAIFSLISLGGFVLIVLGKGDAEFIEIYEPPAWAMHATGLMMLLAIVCMVSFIIKTRVRNMTAHPMLWGVTFWSVGHLIANGDLASLLLFGSFLGYALFTMINARSARPDGLPSTLIQDGVGLVVSSLLYMALMMGHGWFAGISLMA